MLEQLLGEQTRQCSSCSSLKTLDKFDGEQPLAFSMLVLMMFGAAGKATCIHCLSKKRSKKVEKRKAHDTLEEANAQLVKTVTQQKLQLQQRESEIDKLRKLLADANGKHSRGLEGVVCTECSRLRTRTERSHQMGFQLATENASLQTEHPQETAAQLACEKSSLKEQHAEQTTNDVVWPELLNWLDTSQHQSDSDSMTPVRAEDSDGTCNLPAYSNHKRQRLEHQAFYTSSDSSDQNSGDEHAYSRENEQNKPQAAGATANTHTLPEVPVDPGCLSPCFLSSC